MQQQHPPSRHPRVAVVGAGVIGLSSALLIQRHCSEVKQVTVIADKFSPDTTSDVAGGLWEPYTLGDTDSELIRELTTSTHEHMVQLSTSTLSQETGARLLSGFYLGIDEAYDWTKSVVFGHRELTARELDIFPGVTKGRFHTTAKLDLPRYMVWLMKRFEANGGIYKKEKLQSLSELYDQYDVIVNCCGLGARELLGDQAITAAQGQVLRIRCPWVKHFYVLDDGKTLSYFLPGEEYAVLGGTNRRDAWSTTPDPITSARIWETAIRLWPQLKGAEVLGANVGLRPVRTSLRLESETVSHGDRRIPVIHNYGHGGAGITLHWGCAQRAANMVAAAILPQGILGPGASKL